VSDSAFLPQIAQWDGRSFWAGVGAMASMNWQSFSSAGQCHPDCIGGCRTEFYPAVKLDVPPFNPPFKMQ
jgi:hypothetical protein